MAVGWMAFMGSWLMNVLFYKVHPSSVDFSKKGMREKFFIHVQGEKRYLPGYKKWESKGEKYCIVRISLFFLETKDKESTESDSKEKSFLEKMKSCLCCCFKETTTAG